MKEKLKQLYLIEKKSIRELMQILNISRKKVLRLLKQYDLHLSREESLEKRAERNEFKYGMAPQKLKSVKEKISKANKKAYSTGIPQQKYKETMIKIYGTDNYSATTECQEKAKKTCLERYGVNSYSQTSQFKEKRYQTMKKNNSFNIGGVSKAEDKAYQMLLEYFSENDIERQYKTKEYPFNCDFYIKSLDLYIEYQGGQYHGKHPFNSDNFLDQQRLERLKQKEFENKSKQRTPYTAMIRVWTELDPKKREIAKENRLNWKEFFNLEELDQWLRIPTSD